LEDLASAALDDDASEFMSNTGLEHGEVSDLVRRLAPNLKNRIQDTRPTKSDMALNALKRGLAGAGLGAILTEVPGNDAAQVLADSARTSLGPKYRHLVPIGGALIGAGLGAGSSYLADKVHGENIDRTIKRISDRMDSGDNPISSRGYHSRESSLRQKIRPGQRFWRPSILTDGNTDIPEDFRAKVLRRYSQDVARETPGASRGLRSAFGALAGAGVGGLGGSLVNSRTPGPILGGALAGTILGAHSANKANAKHQARIDRAKSRLEGDEMEAYRRWKSKTASYDPRLIALQTAGHAAMGAGLGAASGAAGAGKGKRLKGALRGARQGGLTGGLHGLGHEAAKDGVMALAGNPEGDKRLAVEKAFGGGTKALSGASSLLAGYRAGKKVRESEE
jgi:hypothetical protein